MCVFACAYVHACMCVCVTCRPRQGRAVSGWPVEGEGEDAERVGGEGNGAPGESGGGGEGGKNTAT